MNFNQLVPKGSLLFAPMEGITDPTYRQALLETFPEWDRLSTDFLRIPSVGHLSEKRVIEHFGVEHFNNPSLKKKTTLQILASVNSNLEDGIKVIDQLNFDHLDLNLGCPSKKVNSHKGGAYLLSELQELKKIIRVIRKNFNNVFTVKIRIGYRDDSNFIDALKLFEDEGVEAITLHARTRDQLYKGVADWNYIKKAVESSNLPIIGNGDVWTVEDIDKVFNLCGCHAIMFGRGALKTPWLAKLYKDYKNLNSKSLLDLRTENAKTYYTKMQEGYLTKGLEEELVLKRLKAFSRYIFDDYNEPQKLKSLFLRSKSLNEFNQNLSTL